MPESPMLSILKVRPFSKTQKRTAGYRFVVNIAGLVFVRCRYYEGRVISGFGDGDDNPFWVPSRGWVVKFTPVSYKRVLVLIESHIAGVPFKYGVCRMCKRRIWPDQKTCGNTCRQRLYRRNRANSKGTLGAKTSLTLTEY